MKHDNNFHNSKKMPQKDYNDYPSYIKRIFKERVQKLSVNAGLSCPNRDGQVGIGGCTFCNNQSFNPEYCHTTASIRQQLEKGIAFFSKKYKTQKYLAYFQAYTNTYGELDDLKQQYEEALAHPAVIGLVIGTRPDCMSDELLIYFKDLQEKDYYVAIEYGVESTRDDTLLFINRGHDFASSKEAITRTAAHDLPVGAHLILGLPHEAKSDFLQHAAKLSALPLTMLKLHQLQLVKGTTMEMQFQKHPEWFRLYSAEEYVDVVIDFLEVLHPNIAVERFISQSPHHLLSAPSWGLKNFEFVAKVEKRLKERGAFQGKKYLAL